MGRKPNLKGTVYLIHFSRPLSHATHYLGFTDKENIDQRIARHRKGQGARILKVCNRLGIRWHVARVWFGVDRQFERQKKGCGKARLCPVCSPNIAAMLKCRRRLS